MTGVQKQLVRRKLRAANDAGECPLVAELQNQVARVALCDDPDQPDDVGVVELRRDCGLAHEFAPGVRVGLCIERLDRHRVLKRSLHRPLDHVLRRLEQPFLHAPKLTRSKLHHEHDARSRELNWHLPAVYHVVAPSRAGRAVQLKQGHGLFKAVRRMRPSVETPQQCHAHEDNDPTCDAGGSDDGDITITGWIGAGSTVGIGVAVAAAASIPVDAVICGIGGAVLAAPLAVRALSDVHHPAQQIHSLLAALGLQRDAVPPEVGQCKRELPCVHVHERVVAQRRDRGGVVGAGDAKAERDFGVTVATGAAGVHKKLVQRASSRVEPRDNDGREAFVPAGGGVGCPREFVELLCLARAEGVELERLAQPHPHRPVRNDEGSAAAIAGHQPGRISPGRHGLHQGYRGPAVPVGLADLVVTVDAVDLEAERDAAGARFGGVGGEHGRSSTAIGALEPRDCHRVADDVLAVLGGDLDPRHLRQCAGGERKPGCGCYRGRSGPEARPLTVGNPQIR